MKDLTAADTPPQSSGGDFLYKASAAYLVIPQLLFAAGWLRASYGIPLVLLLGTTLFLVLRRPRTESGQVHFTGRPLASRGHLLGVIVLVTLWLSMSGIGGFGHQSGDYIKHNAMLKDLMELAWPVTYSKPYLNRFPDTQGATLVYYTAYYLPSAIVAKVFGWQAAQIMLLVWSAIGLMLV